MNRDRKIKRYHWIRARYEAKRRTFEWKLRKRFKKQQLQGDKMHQQRQKNVKFINHSWPPVFSFIENTNEMLSYFMDARKILKKWLNVNFNIDNIERLTSDAIVLLVAAINDKNFYYDSICSWDAPKNLVLKNMFLNSGFYRYVNSSYSFESETQNFLVRHQHNWHIHVKGEYAKEMCKIGTKHSFGNEKPYDYVYNIIVECMANTNNHANLGKSEKCSWWLLAYPQKDSDITCYTFLDLGVGIFDSLIVKWYKKFWWLFDNHAVARDLLSWKIWSRMTEDWKIRWKWIPQIIKYAKIDTFKKFNIISNNIKLDLKTGSIEKLEGNFKWTLVYWELQSSKN